MYMFTRNSVAKFRLDIGKETGICLISQLQLRGNCEHPSHPLESRVELRKSIVGFRGVELKTEHLQITRSICSQWRSMERFARKKEPFVPQLFVPKTFETWRNSIPLCRWSFAWTARRRSIDITRVFFRTCSLLHPCNFLFLIQKAIIQWLSVFVCIRWSLQIRANRAILISPKPEPINNAHPSNVQDKHFLSFRKGGLAKSAEPLCICNVYNCFNWHKDQISV